MDLKSSNQPPFLKTHPGFQLVFVPVIIRREDYASGRYSAAANTVNIHQSSTEYKSRSGWCC